ncbi:MAG TPA: alpha/beta hydrolase [Steroidobacteraceae bacterium]|nr:alpha/beta hydrolase [Steroidobacteraceae bacterium]
MRQRYIRVDDLEINFEEAGPESGPSILFIHGWPQDGHAFRLVMAGLQDRFRVAAIDLPGIGRSKGLPSSGAKLTLARYVHSVVKAARLEELTLVGHDIGGQIVYAFLRAYPDAIARAAILNVVIPGIAPWSEVIRNPRIWHFGFHAVPDLPELLVAGHQMRYFDFFFDAIAGDPHALPRESRRHYAQAYATPDGLKAGFDWYRAFHDDEKDNVSSAGTPVLTPVLCVRGDSESGDPEAYFAGLRTAGLVKLTGTVIPACGHFSLDERPAAVAKVLREFISGF